VKMMQKWANVREISWNFVSRKFFFVFAKVHASRIFSRKFLFTQNLPPKNCEEA
jgi:hypothetical protein